MIVTVTLTHEQAKALFWAAMAARTHPELGTNNGGTILPALDGARRLLELALTGTDA